MTRTVPVRVGSQPEEGAAGPKPFSSEWHAIAPEQRAPPTRRAPELPGWFPSERAIAAILVLMLVSFTVIVSGAPAPNTTASAPEVSQGAVNQSAEDSTVTPENATGGAGETTVAQTQVTENIGAGGPSTPASEVSPGTVAEGSILPEFRVVSYYGHPRDTNMGILGEYKMQDLLEQLRDEATAYESADPSRPVKPAFEVIASVAQNWPADNDTYLLHTDSDTIQAYVDFTRENGLLLILDLQIGHSSVAAEIDVVREWLVEPHVHLALDPEFSMGDGDIPGEVIGGIDADQIAVAQRELARIVTENNLPPKLLIVHRFTEGMIRGETELSEVAGVQLVIDFDGFGDPASKIENYELFINRDGVRFAGIKLFYQQDDPLLSPEEVVLLDPPPDLVVYQ